MSVGRAHNSCDLRPLVLPAVDAGLGQERLSLVAEVIFFLVGDLTDAGVDYHLCTKQARTYRAVDRRALDRNTVACRLGDGVLFGVGAYAFTQVRARRCVAGTPRAAAIAAVLDRPLQAEWYCLFAPPELCASDLADTPLRPSTHPRSP